MAQITLNSTGVASNGTLALQSNGTTTAVTIDASQNVGVGTASPAAKLDVATTTGFTFATTPTAGVQIGTQGTTGGSFMVQTQSVSASYGSGLAFDGTYSSGTLKSTVNIKAFGVYSSGGYGSEMAFHTSLGATLSERMRIDSSGNVGIGKSSPAQKLDISGNTLVPLTNSYHCYTTDYGIGTPDGNGFQIFWGSGDFARFGNRASGTFTERMRIDSSGNLLVGTTSSNARVVVKGTGGDDFGGGVQWIRGTADNRWEFVVGGDNKFYLGYGSGANPAAVGNFATNGTYTATSDVRKKKDISYEFEGLSLVQALKPAMGRMLDDESSFPLRPFFIAQDIQPVLPSLVSSLDPDSSALNPFLGVDYASITPVLVKAIQEQQAIITQLQADVAALKGTA